MPRCLRCPIVDAYPVAMPNYDLFNGIALY